MEIQNSSLRPEGSWKPHHLRHLISGTIVFFLGVLAQESIHIYRNSRPINIRWTNEKNPIQNDFYFRKLDITKTNIQVQLGLSDDGRVFWKEIK